MFLKTLVIPVSQVLWKRGEKLNKKYKEINFQLYFENIFTQEGQ